MKFFCRLIAFVIAWSLPAVAAGQSAESEIQRLDAARITALLAGEVGTLDRLYADQLVYIHANGRVDTKAGYLAMLRSGDLTYVTLKYDPAPQVRVTGDTAVVTGRSQIEVKSKSGQITKRLLTTTTVFARTPAGWKVVSYQGTPTT